MRLECLDYAIDNKIEDGIWGGESARGRRRFRATAARSGLTWRKTNSMLPAVRRTFGIAIILFVAGCSSSASKTTAPATKATAPATTTTAVATTTTPPPPTTTTPPPVTMPSGDPVFPGYPKLVPIVSLDYRVRSWFSNPRSDQAVAVAPGVYTPYNPNVPDLESYLDGPTDGDCAARSAYFPDSGGACWEGVK